jgi:hypothetical protein
MSAPLLAFRHSKTGKRYSRLGYAEMSDQNKPAPHEKLLSPTRGYGLGSSAGVR